jgi:SAM-dependent methyltransferase
MVRAFIKSNAQKPFIKILNLGCGSCREIAELIADIEYKNFLTFTCIDTDEKALTFSKKALKALPVNIKVEFLKKDFRAMIKGGKGAEFLPQHDLMYSVGLMDYLPDDVLKDWLAFFYKALPKGGKFIVTHKNREKTFPAISPDWFCSWKFIPRSKDEVSVLLHKTLTDFSLDITADDFGYIYYFTLTKK